MPRGMHLAVEGIDGAGKTTVGQIVVALLEAKGERCRWSHVFPGDL